MAIRFRITQAEKNLEYLQFLSGEFKNLGFTYIKIYNRRKDNEKLLSSSTSTAQIHIDLFNFFYILHPDPTPTRKNLKIFPKDLIKNYKMHALDLTTFICDDGHFDFRTSTMVFCVEGFRLEDITSIKMTMQESFNFKSLNIVNHNGGFGKRLILKGRDLPKVFKLIHPYIVSCFEYKCPSLSNGLNKHQSRFNAVNIEDALRQRPKFTRSVCFAKETDICEANASRKKFFFIILSCLIGGCHFKWSANFNSIFIRFKIKNQKIQNFLNIYFKSYKNINSSWNITINQTDFIGILQQILNTFDYHSEVKSINKFSQNLDLNDPFFQKSEFWKFFFY